MSVISLVSWVRQFRVTRLSLCGVVLLLGSGMIATLPARSWKDATGRKVEAEYVSHDDSNLTMRLKNGREMQYPIEKLSEEDQKYLEEMKPAEERDAGSGSSEGAGEEKGDLNWDEPWPDKITFKDDPQIEVVKEDKESKKFVYESENYRFTCDVRLSKSVVGTFADMFEATRLFARAMPLAITGGTKINGKYDILLFETKDSYFKAGGPPGSAGVFMGGRNVVMVPLTSLGVRKVGRRYARDRDKSNGTLIHELIHQLTPSVYYSPGARGWFSEGIAEYCTATRYRSGKFDVKGNFDDIEEYATAHGKDDSRGRALGKEFDAPDLQTYMLMSYSQFAGANGNFNYGLGLIITTYYLHLDGEKDAARMKAFLKKLRSIGNRGDTTKALDELLDGRSWDEMEADIHKAWRKKGVKINFQ